MSHLNPGLISAYNSLTDKHLAGYFSNTRIRRHLQRVGLITRSGRIVPDKEYRNRLMHRVHQKHVRECLAQAIFHKVLDMERVHQIDIKRRLEEFARRERVHKMKVERSKRYEEDLIQILSPRPPTGPRGVRTQHSVPEGEPSESSDSPGSSRPHTAPETVLRPARLQPITCSGTAASLRRRPPRRHRVSADHRQQQPLDGTNPDDRNPLKRGITAELCQGVSPYCLPVINNFVTPVPPTTKRRDRGTRVTSNGTVRGRRLRSSTTTDANEEPPMLRGSVHQSRVGVNMVYCGKTVHLSRDLVDLRDEVKVFQQHCGGENLCVYKGRLQEGEAFQFVSRRHRGFPFSLTFFLNGLQVERISSCCEFKHRRGSRLTGRRKHFGFTGVEGASPCYKCIIAMGLDKKPTPPPKRVTDGTETETTSSPSDAHKETAEEKEREEVEEDEEERTASTADPRTPQPQDMETDIKEEIIHEDKPRDDYEEDFEADDEADENSKAKQSKAPSHSSDKEQQRKDKYASDSEDDDGDEGSRSRSASRSSSSERPSEDEDPKGDHRHAAESEDPRGDADPPEPRREEPPAEPAAGDPPTEADTPDTEIPAPSSSPPSPPSPPPDPPAAPAAAEEAEDHGGNGRDTGETAPEESETSVPPGSEGKGHEDTPTPASAADDGEGEGVPAEPERGE
uniref:Glutamate-rich 3 n=2 Tax=Gadus morhua TaxID=8049 RepID=A0A8C5AGK1_GADMO